PALYNLANDHQLSEKFRLVGVDLADMSAAQWRAHLTEAMKGFVAHDGEFHLDDFDQTTWQWLTDRMSYLPGDLNNPDTYRRLGEADGIGQDRRPRRQPPVLSRRRRPLLRPGGR